jgi:hypothetical protein
MSIFARIRNVAGPGKVPPSGRPGLLFGGAGIARGLLRYSMPPSDDHRLHSRSIRYFPTFRDA